jgi:uncharacterized membrane protein
MQSFILEYPIWFLAQLIGYFHGNFGLFAIEALKIFGVTTGWIGGLALFVWYKDKRRFSRA